MRAGGEQAARNGFPFEISTVSVARSDATLGTHDREHAMYALHLFKMARPGEGPFKLVLKFT